MAGLKTVFRRVRGKVIPIRVSSTKKEIPDELQKIKHVQRARKFAREKGLDYISGKYLGIAKKQSKRTGFKIARRIKRLGLKSGG